MARTIDTGILDYIRRQPLKPNLNVVSYFVKKELKREVSEPDAAGGEGFDAMKAEFKLKEFIHQMKIEANAFRAWRKAADAWLTSKEAAEHQWRATDASSLAEALNSAVTDNFPVFRSEQLSATPATSSWALKSAADYHEVTSSAKVGVMNCTYLGNIKESDLLDVATHVSGFVNQDAANNSYIVIAPTAGMRGGSQGRDTVRRMSRSLEAALKDESKRLEVINFTISYDPATAYSAKTMLRSEGFFLISNVTDESYQLESRWTKSALFLREAVEDRAKFLARSDFVNPTAKPLASRLVATGHVEREIKQYTTGPGVYIPLLTTLLSGMSFKPTELVSIVEDCGYDAQLAKTAISMVANPPAKMTVPKLSVITHIWAGSRESAVNTHRFCVAEIRGHLKEAVQQGFKLKNYSPLPPLRPHGDMPAISLDIYKLSVPNLANRTLKVQHEEFSKLELAQKAKQWLDDFNMEFNPEGGFYNKMMAIQRASM